ncbi:MAG: RDD family protein, partial [Sedimentisphaerales bacterium]|nr:RDD family protein [Sedimentisphaerales bacterium]
ACLLLVAMNLTAAGQEDISNVLPDRADMWAGGNDKVVYLVPALEKDGQKGFQIFQRYIAGAEFLAGQWYTGRPTAMTASEERLVVFLRGGGCQSYDLLSSRTERRLPTGLRIIDCAYEGNVMYALTQAEQTIVLLLPTAYPTETSKEQESNAVVSPAPVEDADGTSAVQTKAVLPREQQWPLLEGDIILLRHHKDNRWRMMSGEPLPITDWDNGKIRIESLAGKLHLFGVRDGVLEHCRSQEGYCSDRKILPINEPVRFLNVLRVNREIRIVAAVETQNEKVLFRVGRRGRDSWIFSEPLEKNAGEVLVSSADKVVFAPFGQNIAAFSRLGEREVLFGQYSGSGKLIESFDKPIESIRTETEPLWEWLFGTQSSSVALLIVISLVFWRREEAFSEPQPLPNGLQPASVWRRAGAFMLDSILISLGAHILRELLRMTLLPELTDFSLSYETLVEQINRGTFSAQMKRMVAIVTLIYYVVFFVYFTLCELLFARTPGKKALGLTVVSVTGEKMSAQQALIRNVVRLFDFFPSLFFYAMTLMIVSITRRQQRSGDLAARTMVVMSKRVDE